MRPPVFDHFTVPDAHFFLVLTPRHSVEGGLRLLKCRGALRAHAGAPERLLAYEKEVNEGFIKTA